MILAHKPTRLFYYHALNKGLSKVINEICVDSFHFSSLTLCLFLFSIPSVPLLLSFYTASHLKPFLQSVSMLVVLNSSIANIHIMRSSLWTNSWADLPVCYTYIKNKKCLDINKFWYLDIWDVILCQSCQSLQLFCTKI